MADRSFLPHRAVIEIAGGDRIGFLQGLVSNDVAAAAPDRAVWAAMLTPQGRYLADLFATTAGDRLLIDTESDWADEMTRRLQRFRLRADVAIVPRPDLGVSAEWGADAAGVPDPRLPGAGTRRIHDRASAPAADVAAWDAHRIPLGLPDGVRDLERERTLLLEAGFDELHGVSWTKGCYMGQELTARTRYRGLLKRRLVPVHFDGAEPTPGTPVTAAGEEVGMMRSTVPGTGLAMIRLDAIGRELACAGRPIRPAVPGWMVLQPRP